MTDDKLLFMQDDDEKRLLKLVEAEMLAMQPLKFQTDATNREFMIYSRSTAIWMIASDPEIVENLRVTTGMTKPLQKKFFMGTQVDGQIVINAEIGELPDQGW